jgi:hypothetical protein
MFKVVKMLKDKEFGSGADTIRPTRDGELPMLTSTKRKKERDITETTDSISPDHSTSDQECQCKELLRESEVMLDSEDGERTKNNNNSSSILLLRQSSLKTQNPGHLKFQIREEITNSE